MTQPLALAGITVSRLVFAFLRNWLIVITFGAGVQSDAYLAAGSVPQFVTGVLAATLALVLIPIFTEAQRRGKPGETVRLFAVTVGGGMIVLSVLLIVAARPLMQLLVPGFEPAARELTVTMTRLQLVTMLLTATASVFWSANYALRRFVRAESVLLLAAVAELGLLVVVLRKWGIVAAAAVTIVRGAIELVLLAPGTMSRALPADAREQLREVWRRVRPLLAGQAYFRTDFVVDRLLASLAPRGVMSLLALTHQMYSAASLIAQRTIGTPAIPPLSTYAQERDWLSFRGLFARRMRFVFGVSLAAYLAIVFFGRQLLPLLIGYGGVTHENIELLWTLLVLSGGLLLAAPAGHVLAAAMHAVGDTRSQALAGAIAYTIALALKVILFLRFGVQGLAIAISVYYLLSLLLQFAFRRTTMTRLYEQRA